VARPSPALTPGSHALRPQSRVRREAAATRIAGE
jgi:hypothetical protein